MLVHTFEYHAWNRICRRASCYSLAATSLTSSGVQTSSQIFFICNPYTYYAGGTTCTTPLQKTIDFMAPPCISHIKPNARPFPPISSLFHSFQNPYISSIDHHIGQNFSHTPPARCTSSAPPKATSFYIRRHLRLCTCPWRRSISQHRQMAFHVF